MTPPIQEAPSVFRAHVANVDELDRTILAALVAVTADPGLAEIRTALRAGDICLCVSEGFVAFRAVVSPHQDIASPIIAHLPDLSATLERCVNAAGEAFGAGRDAVLSKSRMRHLCDARMVSMVLYREISGSSALATSRAFRRSRGVAEHSLRKVRIWSQTDPNFLRRVNLARALLGLPAWRSP